MTDYSFGLPDMIGGNEYGEKANAEMMIRWTQLNALLPAMQFSLPPWEYGEHSADASACRRYAKLHTKFAQRIFALAEETTRTGAPIIRHVFWLDVNNETALTCDDEFCLPMKSILVVPVFFPLDTRQDRRTKQIFHGSTLIKDYSAPLEILPLFGRISGLTDGP